MQDTQLFETILGLQAPWRVSRLELDATQERVDVWVEHAGTSAGRVPRARPSSGVATMRPSGRGAISTPVSIRRSCMRGCLGWRARRTGCAKSGCRGRRRGAASRN